MQALQVVRAGLRSGAYRERLRPAYGRQVEQGERRLLELTDLFQREFAAGDDTPVALYSAAGRTELGGNHTDHQRGRVLTASISLDTIACVARRQDRLVRLQSLGHELVTVDLDDLAPREAERETAAALVRGIANRLTEMGYALGGFDAYTTTQVLAGSGLSSSAAFEVLVGEIFSHLFCGGALTATENAKIGQYAENVYFGKPSGLMDQMGCATGGVISIDFRDNDHPAVKQVKVDLDAAGYALCIIDSGASHADLTEDYAAVPREMGAVAAFFGREVLSQVDPAAFYERLPEVRAACGDRAVLRAIHFFDDDAMVDREREALERGDFDAFLSLVTRSGLSSFRHLQNVCTYRNPREQAVVLVLALAEKLLGGRGACRVHGGGFAGTVQAFVPLDMLEAFRAGIDRVFGQGACHVLTFRPVGALNLID